MPWICFHQVKTVLVILCKWNSWDFYHVINLPWDFVRSAQVASLWYFGSLILGRVTAILQQYNWMMGDLSHSHCVFSWLHLRVSLLTGGCLKVGLLLVCNKLNMQTAIHTPSSMNMYYCSCKAFHFCNKYMYIQCLMLFFSICLYFIVIRVSSRAQSFFQVLTRTKLNF